MSETLVRLQIPTCPQYTAGPVIGRRVQIRAKKVDGALMIDVPLEASTRKISLPVGARCFIELVNVIHAEGSVEQDRLDFIAGKPAGYPPGLQVSGPIDAEKVLPIPPLPIAPETEAPSGDDLEDSSEPASDSAADPPCDDPPPSDPPA
jgi:hypothetical protein